MNRPRAIQIFEDLLDAYDNDEHDNYFFQHSSEVCEAAIFAHSDMREQSDREHPQPLTLEELKERVGKPVWFEWIPDKTTSGWDIFYTIDENLAGFYGCEEMLKICDYGKTWLVYANEPKEQ